MSNWTEIEITGGSVLIDLEDAHLLQKMKWNAERGYARRTKAVDSEGRSGTRYLHREIMKAGPGDYVDHINQNRMDNRKANLRICTNAENLRNRTKQSNNTSGFKGVTLDKRRKVWTAQMHFLGKHLFFGAFKTPEDAATVYNFAAAEIHGEFAGYNTVPQPWLEQA